MSLTQEEMKVLQLVWEDSRIRPADAAVMLGMTEEAVRAAVKDYYDKNGIAYDPEQFKIHDCEHCHD